MKKLILRGLIITLISVSISIILWLSGVFTPFENRVWDERVKLLADKDKTSEDIILVLVDQVSLDWAENEQGLPWPWPREVLTTIINFASRGGAKSINFDVLYTEASLYGVWDDTAFGESINQSGIFIGSTALTNAETGVDHGGVQGVSIDGYEKWINNSSMKQFAHITKTIPELWSNSQYLCNVIQEPDTDGVFRRGQLFYLLEEKVIPSHALASYMISRDNNAKLSINKNYLTIDDYKIPINKNGEVILNYRGPSGTHKSYSAAKIINSELTLLAGEVPEIDPELFRDKHIYFGYKAPGLYDNRATPISGGGAGVEIHTTMLDNLLGKDFIMELSPLYVILLALLISGAAGILFSCFQRVHFSLINTIISLLIPLILSVIYYKLNIWYPLVFSEVCIILTLTGSGIMNFTTEGKQKRFIKSAFKQYLSPDVIEHILENPGQLKLGGEKREISIFFSDLQGFTSIAENLTPESLTKLINEYLTAMTDIIQEEGGTIDKYEGDAIIAFWNAPINFDDHAQRCVRAAIRCQEKLAELRPYFREMTGHNLHMRIGINTGEAVVGNMGSQSRFDYTMLGDSVNLAARLEGINKTFATKIIISQFTLKQISDIPVREIGRVRVVGREQPILLYEPLMEEVDTETFQRALELFYNGEFEEALDLFDTISDMDKSARKYCWFIQELIDRPPRNWDGVITMKSK